VQQAQLVLEVFEALRDPEELQDQQDPQDPQAHADFLARPGPQGLQDQLDLEV
jgi:hypothetical protein